MNPHSESCSGCLAHADHDRNTTDFDLLSPLTIRGVTLRNRIGVSPMCQYSSIDGFADDWHLVHLGSRAVGGAGLIFTEATAVTPDGRITPGDLGIWDDNHIEMLSRVVNFIHRMGSVSAIQLAHAGRKGSCDAPWNGGGTIPVNQGGWTPLAPSAIPFSEASPIPKALELDEIKNIIASFKNAAQRAIKAGFKILEIHSAHGYLLHEFLSPLTNQRTDQYGGSLENRMRLLCEIVTEVRSAIPHDMPLFVRISATDWFENGWDIDQSIELAKTLRKLSVDLIDVSSGGTVPHAKIPVGKSYQVPFASAIRKHADILTATVGLITEADQANEIITTGEADIVFIGREFLREPYWPLKAQQHLNQTPSWPTPYGYAVKRRS